MQYPSRADYTQAIRDYPQFSLKDRKLSGGNPKRGSDNFPISYSGGFSCVFPIEVDSGTYALRCWIKEVRDAETRYQKISDYLKHVGLPYFVDFDYVPQGVMVNGTEYPITRMEWAEGETLRDFIERNLQDSEVLRTAADEFRKMVKTLHDYQISHGDLQDGNILIKRNGNRVVLKLIDYDSLFVPTLRGYADSIVGLPEYQHPQRMAGGRQADEKVDYFSELVIYLSFRGLAEKPELWNQFKGRTEKGLLFSSEDFKNPDTSNIFRALQTASSDVRHLADILKHFCSATSVELLAPLEVVAHLRTRVAAENIAPPTDNLISVNPAPTWDEIVRAHEEGTAVSGRVTKVVNSGLRVMVGNFLGFLPASQVEMHRVPHLERYVGEVLDMKVIRLNRRPNFVVSRRAWLEAQQAQKRAAALRTLKVGQRVTGVVKSITDFGAFIDLGGFDGLLHKSEIAWKRINHPSEVVSIGETVEVQILSIDKEAGKIALGLKQLAKNPWADVEHKYPIGATVQGKVIKMLDSGALVQIEEGVVGLVHVSEMSWTQNNAVPSDFVSEGDEVEAVVLNISKKTERISLSIKQSQQSPLDRLVRKYQV